MRKIVPFALLLCLAALPAGAASTCETRVDNHQNASTSQRVAYCLGDDETWTEPERPELIYSGVYGNNPQEEEEVTPTKNKDPYFRANKKTVSQEYVESEQFPDFKNAYMSEQERVALEQKIMLARKIAAGNYHITRQKPARLDTKVRRQVSTASITVETRSGLVRRQTKPHRTMMTTGYTEEQFTETQSNNDSSEDGLAGTPFDEAAPANSSPDTLPGGESLPTAVAPAAADAAPYDMPLDATQDVPYGVQDPQSFPELPPADASSYGSLDEPIAPYGNN